MSIKAGMRLNERMIRADGIELETEAFGDPAHPPVLLIMGAMASMLWWPDEFCERLPYRGRHVVRYDNRDTLAARQRRNFGRRPILCT
jgi:pimeloyl-ACP methyl ester carboxylesterase